MLSGLSKELRIVGPWGKEPDGCGELEAKLGAGHTFACGPEIRKVIYTTYEIERLRMHLREVLKNRGHFPSDESAVKLIYLALRNVTEKWSRPPLTRMAAAGQLAIPFETRFFLQLAEEKQPTRPTLNTDFRMPPRRDLMLVLRVLGASLRNLEQDRGAFIFGKIRTPLVLANTRRTL